MPWEELRRSGCLGYLCACSKRPAGLNGAKTRLGLEGKQKDESSSTFPGPEASDPAQGAVGAPE